MTKLAGISWVALGAATVFAAQPALAQNETESGLLEEVTVTAQRRTEAVQDVPIAITAFNSDQLSALGVVDALDLTKLVPNLMGHNNTGPGTSNNYAIRALNNTESIATFDAPVGTYVDDIYIARQNANNLTLFDVNRVEILRGPQGTLFGRNTTGGAVTVILNRPAESSGGYLEAGFGQFGRRSFRGSVDIPASDRVRTKVSAYWVEDDGYATNLVTGQKLNGEDNKGIRAAVSFDLSDKATWDLALTHTDTNDTNLINFSDGGHRFIRSGLRTDTSPFAPVVTGSKGNFGLQNEVKALLFSSNLSFDTAWGDLSFITGVYDLKQEFALDFSVPNTNPRGGFAIVNQGRHKELTQEVKLTGSIANDKLDYVAGAYYFSEDNDTDFADIAGGTVTADRTLLNDTKAYAVYVQGDWHFTDKWTATFGVRYTDETKEIEYLSNNNANITGAARPGVVCVVPTVLVCETTTANLRVLGIPLEQSTEIVTPRFALKFKPNDNLNFFYSSTRGFKSGGWNARSGTANGILPFSPEKVWSHEIGMKSDLFGRKLRVNLTAFKMDVEDYQLPSAFTPPGAVAPVFLTQNFASLENTGFEAEFIWQPIERLNILLNLGFQDAKYVDPAPGVVAQRDRCIAGLGGQVRAPATTVVTTITGNCGVGIVTMLGNYATPTRAPEFTGTLYAGYTIRLGSFELTPSFTIHDMGKINTATSELPPAVTTITGTAPNTVTRAGIAPGAHHDGWTEISAGLNFKPQDGNWSLSANCSNCNNELQVVSSFLGLYYNDPRSWNLSFRYDFKNR